MGSTRCIHWAVSVLFAIASAGACGTGASTVQPDGGCAAGDEFCATCSDAGFCSHGCPAVACPGDGGMGGDGVAEAGADASGCPAATPSFCLDCNGVGFCVSGSCPVAQCLARDAGTDASLPVCPGASGPMPGYPICRSSADCANQAQCAEQPIGGCGVNVSAEHQCTTDATCATGVCEPYVETNPCCSGSCNGTRCVPKCPTNACASDSQCLASGHCQPTACGQGYMCPTDLACKPGDAMADRHGCAVKLCTEGFACTSDEECNQGAATKDIHGCAPKPCSSGYACPMAWHCVAGPNSDSHGCSPIPCSSAAPCGVNETCDPTQPGRGCVPRTCSGDHDCNCGACVEGTCRSSLWVCSSAPL